jgi:hypothetical protein
VRRGACAEVVGGGVCCVGMDFIGAGLLGQAGGRDPCDARFSPSDA